MSAPAEDDVPPCVACGSTLSLCAQCNDGHWRRLRRTAPPLDLESVPCGMVRELDMITQDGIVMVAVAEDGMVILEDGFGARHVVAMLIEVARDRARLRTELDLLKATTGEA